MTVRTRQTHPLDEVAAPAGVGTPSATTIPASASDSTIFRMTPPCFGPWSPAIQAGRPRNVEGLRSERAALPPQDPVGPGDLTVRPFAILRGTGTRPQVAHRAVREHHRDDFLGVLGLGHLTAAWVCQHFRNSSHVGHLLPFRPLNEPETEGGR